MIRQNFLLCAVAVAVVAPCVHAITATLTILWMELEAFGILL